MAGSYEDSPQDREKNRQVDELATQHALAWRSGELLEAVARSRLYFLVRETHVLDLCAVQQAERDVPQARDDMRDWMSDLLERKCLAPEGGGSCLDLDRVADGASLTGWARTLLTGAGRIGRQRLTRARMFDRQRLARASDASEFGLTTPDAMTLDESRAQIVWSAPQVSTDDAAIEAAEAPLPELDVPAHVDSDYADLLHTGSRNAARIAAFAARGSSYRGHRRRQVQVALVARMMDVPPPPRMPLSRREDRQQARQWCLDNPGGERLKQLLTDMCAGRDLDGAGEDEMLVVSLFEGYSLGQAAALTTKPGYVLVHMAQAAVEPSPPPRKEIVAQMAAQVTEYLGERTKASRLVRRWAGAHAELTGSEYAGRGAKPKLKSPEQAEVDEELFKAEAIALIERGVTRLGPSPAAVRTFMDSMYEDLMVEELDAQVDEWITEPGDGSRERAGATQN